MFKRAYKGIPAPPGAGLVKIADPRRVRSGWLIAIGLVLVIGGATWNLGLGRTLDEMRCEFLAIAYLHEAQAEAEAQPVQREAALASLQRAIALAPPRLEIADQAADLFIGLRAYQQAIPWLKRAPGNSLLVRVSLGECLLMAGQRDAGDQIMSEVLRAASQGHQQRAVPDQLFALLLNDIGYVHVAAGFDLTASRNLIRTATRLMPAEPAFIDSLGWAEYRLGNYSDAAFYLERAVRLYLPKESAEVYYHLGAAYARLGRRTDARRVLERCLSLDPSFTEAADELERLSQELPRPAVV